MTSALYDLAVLQHHDGVGVSYGGKPVRDDECRAVLHEPVHAALNRALGTGIHGGCRLVQYKDRRFGQSCPRDIDQLPLTLGKVCSIPFQPGLITVLQSADKVIGRRGPRRSDDFLVRRVQSSVTDVFHHGIREQMRVLQHHRDILPENITLDIHDVHAVDRDMPFLHVIKTVQKVGHRCLPGTGRTDKRDLLSRMRIKADMFEDQPVRIVSERNVVKTNISPHAGHRGRAFAVGFLRFGIHNIEHALRAGERGEDRRHLLRYLRDGHAELARIVCEDRQSSRCHGSEHHQNAADAYRDRVIDLGGIAHDGTHDASPEVRPELRAAHIVVQKIEFRLALVLMIEYLDDLLPRNGFFHVSVHGTERCLLSGIILPRVPADDHAAKTENRKEHDRDQRQNPAGRNHEYHGSDQRDCA